MAIRILRHEAGEGVAIRSRGYYKGRVVFDKIGGSLRQRTVEVRVNDESPFTLSREDGSRTVLGEVSIRVAGKNQSGKVKIIYALPDGNSYQLSPERFFNPGSSGNVLD
jgi:hypothetical protein